MNNWHQQLTDIINRSLYQISDIEPAAWAEQRMKLSSGRFQGPLKYDISPFSVEIINCLSPNYPATEVVVMGAAKWGKTKTIIEPAIAYWISENPCEMLYLTGHSDLSDESMAKLDNAIDSAGLGHLIKSQSLRATNKRSGDTVKSKEFPLGSLISGSATNHKLLRQRDPKFVIADDIEAAKNASKESGSTVAMIRKRTNSFGNTKKIFWCSTPELEDTSIIKPLYLEGDQRHYHVPCQYCGVPIVLDWEGVKNDEKYGFTWRMDHGKLVTGSVEYICQECGHGFDDSNKYEFNLAGFWVPSVEPAEPLTVSFHLPAWYQAPGMDDWEAIVREYLKACPPGQPRNEPRYKTWLNLSAGQTYTETFEELSADSIQSNIADYEVGTVPERQSKRHGNGQIVLLTCAADCNGTVENGRLDYEIVAWPETGSPYSVMQGSIGTFVPAVLKRKGDELRDETPWTYEENKPYCIWDAFEKILNMQFPVEVSGTQPRNMPIAITGLDCGNTYKNHVYTFIDRMVNKGITIYGVKGRSDSQYYYTSKDATVYHKGKEVLNLWTLDTGYIKDRLATHMGLKWNLNEESQPSGYMNFPKPVWPSYQKETYFAHFESEKRVIVANKTNTDAKAQWQKMHTDSQNHFWDCRVYNMAMKDIWILVLNEKYKPVKIDWAKYCETITAQSWYK